MGVTVATQPPTGWSSYRRHLRDREFWEPLLVLAAKDAGVDCADAQLAQPAGTYPTFLGRDGVLKLYTEVADGGRAWTVERSILAALEPPPPPAPRLLGAGALKLRERPYWYVVMERVAGEPLSAVRTRLSRAEMTRVAHTLGEWVAQLHATPVLAEVLGATGSYAQFLEERRHGLAQRLRRWGSMPTPQPSDRVPLPRSMPPALSEQAPGFVSRWLPSACEQVLVHGDIHGDHLLGGGRPWRPRTLIDFGDGRPGGRLYELGPIVTGTLDGDRALLGEFLRGYGAPRVEPELFARQALATALLHDFDLFAEWRERLVGVESLEELALLLFGPAYPESGLSV